MSLIMAIMQILKYPDPRLRLKASPIDLVDHDIKDLVNDMFETMWHASGIGLAATQVDIHKRIVVMDLNGDGSTPRVFINPEIEVLDPTFASYEEGCLSIPDVTESVERPSKVTIKALDQDGKSFQEDATGLLAVCIQHEIDHLEGKLFVDYLSSMKRQRIRKKLKKNRE